jgi:hypothetical protein
MSIYAAPAFLPGLLERLLLLLLKGRQDSSNFPKFLCSKIRYDFLMSATEGGTTIMGARRWHPRRNTVGGVLV